MAKPEIVVALGGPNRGSDLGDDTRARVEASMQLAINRDIPLILMSGAGAEAMRDYAQASRYAASLPRVEADTRPRDTIGDAHYTKVGLVVPKGIGSLVVCTADYHIKRAGYIFDRVLGENYDIQLHPAEVEYSLVMRAQNHFRERVATIFDNILLLGVESGDDIEREARPYDFHHDYGDSKARFIAASLRTGPSL